MKLYFKSIPGLILSMFLFSTLHAQEYADPTKTLETGKAPGLKVKLLSSTSKTRTYILIFSKGDEVVAGLTEFGKTRKSRFMMRWKGRNDFYF